MKIILIGVDCATEPRKTGLARAEFDGENCCLLDVELGSNCPDPASQICEWISDEFPTLIALDAPLGWPDVFGSKLSCHKAGEPIKGICREVFFDRETDRIVHKESEKKPLSVGADRIARTTFVALEILEKIRTNLHGMNLDVLIDKPPNLPDLKKGISAIEVYPAATLNSYECPNTGYKEKKNDHRNIRKQILRKLRLNRYFKHEIKRSLRPGINQSHRKRMLDEPDALDAVICILAALDFLKGEARGPEDLERVKAEKEGWIWFKRHYEDARRGSIASSHRVRNVQELPVSP